MVALFFSTKHYGQMMKQYQELEELWSCYFNSYLYDRSIGKLPQIWRQNISSPPLFTKEALLHCPHFENRIVSLKCCVTEHGWGSWLQHSEECISQVEASVCLPQACSGELYTLPVFSVCKRQWGGNTNIAFFNFNIFLCYIHWNFMTLCRL